MNRPRVAVLAATPPTVIARLAQHADVRDLQQRPPEAWPPALADADGILIASTVRVDAALLQSAPKLRVIATSSVGYDNVDLAAVAARGIAFSNARGSLNDAVADLTLALVVLARRNLGAAMAWARSGAWKNDGPAPFGRDVAGATLGILGLGDIGVELVPRARAAKMRVIYHNRNRRPDDETLGVEYRPFGQLLAESDVLVVLVPLSEQTRGLIGTSAIAAMKPDAIVVNVARGPIVDTAALLAALEAGKLGGAALDVTDPYPLPPDHPLYARPDVVIIPHMGSATRETRTRMAMLAADNLIAALDGKPLLTPVAVPT